MGICKKVLTNMFENCYALDRQTDRINLSFFPAHNFITPFQRARCVHGCSVEAARPFCATGPEDGRRVPGLLLALTDSPYARTSGHPKGNGHRATMPRDERGIAVSGQGKESKFRHTSGLLSGVCYNEKMRSGTGNPSGPGAHEEETR